MSRVSIKQIPNESKLNFLGNLFTDTRHNGQWQIGTYFSGGDSPPASLDISLLPILGLKRTFRQSPREPFKLSGYTKRFILPDPVSWRRISLRTWLLLSRSWKDNEVGDQLCFHFQVNGMTIWLPTIECARSLFFTSAYLTRAAFQPNGLDQLFRITHQEETVRIEALAGNTVPVDEWDRPTYRAHLAWLLLNPENQRAFESIYHHQVKECVVADQHRRWTFNFDPPPLTGCEVTARGWFDEKTNCFLVFEITEFRNLPLSLHPTVEFLHPKVLERVSGTRRGGAGAAARTEPEEMEIEVDGEDAPSSNTRHRSVEVNPIRMNFSQEIITRRIYAGKRNTTGGKRDSEIMDETARREHGVQEGIDSGAVSRAEWNQLSEDESKAIFKTKFVELQKLIIRLADSADHQLLFKTISSLPALSRYTLYLMDGEPRCYLHAVFRMKDGSLRHILEVDTSDGSRAIATKVLRFKEETDVIDKVNKILKDAIRLSLRWHNKTINVHCAGNESIAHPAFRPDGLAQDVLDAWLNRFSIALE